MLISITLKNVNAIEESTIDFSKGSYKFMPENVMGEIVNPLAIYGHNGSGKTSVLRAMGQLIDMMLLPPDNIEPFIVNEFALLESVKKRKNQKDLLAGSIGSIELKFKNEDGDEYKYLIATTVAGFICKEELFKNNKMIFKFHFAIGVAYRDEKTLTKVHPSLVPLLRIYASNKLEDKDIMEAYTFISNFTFIDLPYKNTGNYVHSKTFFKKRQLDVLEEKSEEVKKLLIRYKHFPIYGIKKDTSKSPYTASSNRYYACLEDGDFKGEIDFHFLSSGMVNNSLLLSMVLSVPNNSVIFIDELEQALHPTAIQAFLSIVKEKKIQLLFTSHNTNTLQYLRPDQIYFAKWRKGISKYYKLSNIYPNIREVNNIEKMYLSELFEEYMND